ncbi:Sodium channel protein Nach [Frankliniella fusca]|uniref:Sodium channel protein Nach n=1 Tax=Frankliniella fusca TaxID=407009 RepID=A0AAE1LBH0_9NEOP|nr:Sodium channel protein Nach [Frankliniella fusca]
MGVFSAFKDFLNNTSFHGLRFVAQEERHWSERVFWLVVCLVSWGASAKLMLASWDAFQNNAISFVVESTYLDWNTTFPTVSVCEEDNMERVYFMSAKIYGEDHDFNLDEVLKEISYFRGSAYYIKEFCFDGHVKCPQSGFTELARKIRSGCNDIFVDCRVNNVAFNCCDHFLPLETEIGTCFALNSQQGMRIRGKKDMLPILANRRSPKASVYLELRVQSNVHIHSPEDVPFLNSLSSEVFVAAPLIHKRFGIAVREIENEPGVRDTSTIQRKCRFLDENDLSVYRYYSYSACITQCRKEAQIRQCGCTTHLMPNAKPQEICSLEGLMCLYQHYTNFSVLKTSWSRKEGLYCNCVPSCTEPEYNIVTQESFGISYNTSRIELRLDRLPSERYKRNVVRGRLDMVVSMGGAAGLFVGASLLSFVELLYYFSLRMCRGSSDPDPDEDDKKDNKDRGGKGSALAVPVKQGAAVAPLAAVFVPPRPSPGLIGHYNSNLLLQDGQQGQLPAAAPLPPRQDTAPYSRF